MKTREQLEQEVRAEHADWSDDQVKAEVDRLDAEQRKPDPDPDPDPDPTPDSAAFARLRREKQEAERQAKEARDALAAKERAEAEQAGEWEKLAKTYEQERDEARQELADLRTQITVEKLATTLHFRNADEAIALLPSNLDRSDDDRVRAALTTLAENRPHLIDNGKPGPTGGPAGGPTTDLTIDQVKRMTPQEITARQDEVDAVLTRQQ